MKIDKTVFRQTLFQLVEAVASGGTFKGFGKTTPFLDSLEEFLCMWFDDLYRDPQQLLKDGILTEAEVAILDWFTGIVDQNYPKECKTDIIDTNQLGDDPRWQAVTSAAHDAQRKLRELWKSMPT